jgi:hypothetical protein
LLILKLKVKLSFSEITTSWELKLLKEKMRENIVWIKTMALREKNKKDRREMNNKRSNLMIIREKVNRQ